MTRKLAGALVVLLLPLGLWAQTLDRGEIRGTVYDPHHAAVPGATVTLSSASTGFQRTVTTGANGSYDLPQIPAGEYQIIGKQTGFAVTRVTNLELHVGDSLTLDIDLRLQGQTQTVEVRAEAAPVESTTTGVSQLINSQSIANLPLSGRDYRDLAELSPSAEVVPGLRGGIRLGGQQSDYTGLVIDGGDTTNNFFGEFFGSLETKNFTVPQDAVQEFQVVTNGFAPEFGRSTGGLLNVVTKSGTNQVHGTLHEYYRGGSLTADDALGNPSNISRQNQFGGSIGFPIVKDKQFLFFALDRQLQNGPLITAFGCPAPPCDFAAATLPAGYGAPNLAGLEGTHTQFQNLFSALVHYDNQLSSSQHFSMRAFFTRNNTDGFTGGNGQTETPHAFNDTEHFINQGVNTVFSLNSVLGASKVNELKVLISGEKRARFANSDMPAANIAGVGVIGQEFFLPGNNDNGKLQVQDNFNYVFTKHDVKFGGDVDTFQDKKDIFAGWSRGEYFYNSLQDFEQGNVASYDQGFGLNSVDFFKAATLKPNYQTGLGFYGQDKWTPSPRFTLTYGLRWDLTWNPQPQSPTPGQDVYVGVGPIGPSGSHLVAPPQKVPNDFTQLGPRVGFAYALGSTRSTVIRGAWGLYYAQTPPIFFPTVGNSNISNFFGIAPPAGGFPNYYPSSLPVGVGDLCDLSFGGLGGPGTGYFCPPVFYTDPAFRNPRVSNLTAGVEHQFGRDWSFSATYVFVHSDHLRTGGFSTTQWARNVVVDHYDQFGRAILVPFDPADPTIAFGGFGTYETASFSHGNYHEFTASLQKRFSKHYQAFANYTLASNKDNASSERDTDSFFGPQDPFNINLDYGRNGLDLRNQFKFGGVADLRYGFTLSGTVLAHSGFAYPAYDVVDVNGDFVVNQFSNNDRPTVTENGKAFLLPRYPARQPGFFEADLRAAKNFRFNERYNVLLSADFFNLFNTEQLSSNPDVNGFVADQLSALPAPGQMLTPGIVYGHLDQIAPGGTPFAVQLGARFEF
ncbi:MAG TPA: carboxypeptidase regulatory-like domain-containing protein [Terriglobia bacterium]|nr:carboxypeptidase regulatory-like domain-containing protein [Terriglobia bacterium]